MASAESYVTTMTLNDGTFCMVEPEQRKGIDRRVFRHCRDGYEWSHFRDVTENGTRARWYGYASRELPETMRAM